MHRLPVLVLGLSWMLSAGAAAQGGPAGPAVSDAAAPALPFREGDIVSFDRVGMLEAYLPAPFWENREFFFFEGMQLEIGPAFRAYGESDAYRQVTEQNRGKSSIGRDGSLQGYSGGLPFPTDEIDCAGDPEAGSKVIWNFGKAWNGDGSAGRFLFTMWDRGEKVAMYYEGTSRQVVLKGRVEPQYRQDEASPGDIFPDEKRIHATSIDITAPASHTYSAGPYRLLTYRFASADGPLDAARRDELWVYVPALRQVRRWTHKRAEAMSEFTFDDQRSFSGMPPQYHWTCLGEKDVLAPFNTRHLAYPYGDDYDFGPYGTSYANDRWELRKAWVIRFEPKQDFSPVHPYHHKVLYIDSETYEPLYSFAYDRKQRLWKVIWHNHRYSEDWDGTTPERSDPLSEDGVWYRGWEGVEKPMDLRTVSDIIVNVQNGMANRIEYWGSHGVPFETPGELRSYIDVGRLAKRPKGSLRTSAR